MDTLVLNSAWMAISRISVMDALGDLLSGRAEVVDVYDDKTVRSGFGTPALPRAFDALRTGTPGLWKVPSIIRFITKAVFHIRGVKFNRHNVWLRDKGQCQYCSVKLSQAEFTYDHVQPQSKGGATVWTNIVVACVPCNHRKANRYPREAGMRLLRQPKQPKHIPGAMSPCISWSDGMPLSWKSFLESVRYWHSDMDA